MSAITKVLGFSLSLPFILHFQWGRCEDVNHGESSSLRSHSLASPVEIAVSILPFSKWLKRPHPLRRLIRVVMERSFRVTASDVFYAQSEAQDSPMRVAVVFLQYGFRVPCLLCLRYLLNVQYLLCAQCLLNAQSLLCAPYLIHVQTLLYIQYWLYVQYLLYIQYLL